jgi:hypothetical protein
LESAFVDGFESELFFSGFAVEEESDELVDEDSELDVELVDDVDELFDFEPRESFL